jgi:hypothetical protein
MRREWELEDLIECWTLDPEELALLANKFGSLETPGAAPAIGVGFAAGDQFAPAGIGGLGIRGRFTSDAGLVGATASRSIRRRLVGSDVIVVETHRFQQPAVVNTVEESVDHGVDDLDPCFTRPTDKIVHRLLQATIGSLAGEPALQTAIAVS